MITGQALVFAFVGYLGGVLAGFIVGCAYVESRLKRERDIAQETADLWLEQHMISERDVLLRFSEIGAAAHRLKRESEPHRAAQTKRATPGQHSR